MQIYKEGESQININGETYLADENGVIDVPDQAVGTAVWGRGFVSAAGRLAELGRLVDQTPAPAIDKPLPASAVSTTDNAVNDKPASSAKNTSTHKP